MGSEIMAWNPCRTYGEISHPRDRTDGGELATEGFTRWLLGYGSGPKRATGS